MLPRYDNEFSWADSNLAVAQLYEQLTLRHEEQLVLIFVMMPNELAFELCQTLLDFLEPPVGFEPTTC
jgi:hypothetical protein